MRAAARDRSWRVRSVLAEQWPELQRIFGPEVTKAELVAMLMGLLQDQEAEVRAQATLRLTAVGAELDAGERRQLFVSIMPKIAEVCVDLSSHVRIAMSTVIGQLAAVLGKEASITDLIPLLLRLLPWLLLSRQRRCLTPAGLPRRSARPRYAQHRPDDQTAVARHPPPPPRQT